MTAMNSFNSMSFNRTASAAASSARIHPLLDAVMDLAVSVFDADLFVLLEDEQLR